MNRQILLAIIAIIASCSAHAAVTPARDTVIVDHPRKVVVISTDSLLKVKVMGSAKDSTYLYESSLQNVDSNFVSTSTISSDWGFSIGGIGRKSNTEYYSQVESHFLLGFNAPMGAPANMPLKAFESWELWWIIADASTAPWHNGHRFSAGIGVDWRNYRMLDRNQFVKADDGTVSVAPLPEGCDPKFSRIKVFSLTIPLRYHYYYKEWGFSLGPVLNFNTYASIKTRYRLNGEKQKEVYKDIHPSPFTIDFMGTVTTPVIDFYVKYAPCHVLNPSYGPKFHSLSFGIYL